jgi:hypothetical protein
MQSARLLSTKIAVFFESLFCVPELLLAEDFLDYNAFYFNLGCWRWTPKFESAKVMCHFHEWIQQ